ncbi:MAG: hypothetical protein AAGJ97_09045, partial [Planctomycetota bacterium]
RHGVLAGNIANIDTPLYKTRDLDVAGFEQALKSAASHRHGSPAGLPTWALAAGLSMPGGAAGGSEPLSLEQLFPSEIFTAREASPVTLTDNDGNDRDVEREVSELMKNSMLQTFAVNVLAAQTQLMQAVISERP